MIAATNMTSQTTPASVPSEEDCDVLVIGGGPAGSTIAALLATQGRHQDGLVHISELSDRFVKDPREVVKAGDVVRVRVKEVDAERKRIALTMKSGAIDRGGAPKPIGKSQPIPQQNARPPQKSPEPSSTESAFAAALKRAQEKK